MNMLAIEWSLTEISLALGIIISTLGLIKPLHSWIKKKIEKSNTRAERVDALPEILDKMASDIEDIKEANIAQNEEMIRINDKIDDVDSRLLDFERQEIVREVNSTFYGFPSLQDIPDDILQDTLASCEIYIKNGYNHNTKPKCELLLSEYNRRLAEKQEAKHE